MMIEAFEQPQRSICAWIVDETGEKQVYILLSKNQKDENAREDVDYMALALSPTDALDFARALGRLAKEAES